MALGPAFTESLSSLSASCWVELGRDGLEGVWGWVCERALGLEMVLRVFRGYIWRSRGAASLITRDQCLLRVVRAVQTRRPNEAGRESWKVNVPGAERPANIIGWTSDTYKKAWNDITVHVPDMLLSLWGVL